ncbi:MAG: lysophospholipase [Saprospiraceae bacterium]|nr:lysophospholipase [Saprospiraceae bacterium]
MEHHTMWTSYLLAGAIGYAVITLLVYIFQHYFFFRPEILPFDFSFSYPFDFTERTFEMEDGGSVNSLHFMVPNSRGVVLYFKGNSRSIKGWAKFATQFLGNGYDFFVMDYRGFGKSRGKRTEGKLYSDSQQIYKHLQGQYDESSIVIYGRSLGSGIAARIASWNHPACLILDSPYYSFYHNVKRWAFLLPLRWILRYQIRTDQFIKKVEVPIYIIHGDRDRLIPISHSHRLKALMPDQIELKVVAGAGHNDLPDFPEFHEFLFDRLNEIAFSTVL